MFRVPVQVIDSAGKNCLDFSVAETQSKAMFSFTSRQVAEFIWLIFMPNNPGNVGETEQY